MELLGINIIEHPAFSEDEAWIIHQKDAPQVPRELRDDLPIPCILTGNLALTKRTLNLLQAISTQAR